MQYCSYYVLRRHIFYSKLLSPIFFLYRVSYSNTKVSDTLDYLIRLIFPWICMPWKMQKYVSTPWSTSSLKLQKERNTQSENNLLRVLWLISPWSHIGLQASVTSILWLLFIPKYHFPQITWYVIQIHIIHFTSARNVARKNRVSNFQRPYPFLKRHISKKCIL